MKTVKLKELVDFSNGYAFKSTDYVDSSNTVNCRMSNIRPDGSFDIEYNIKYLPDEFAEKYSSFILNDGDIIIAMTDMAGDPKILGVPTRVDTKGYSVLMNQRVGKLTLKSNEIYPTYLKYYLMSSYARNYFKSFAGGGVQLNIGQKEILNIDIKLCDIKEQIYICDVLDRIDVLIRQRNEQLTKLDQLVKSRFIEMFGDVITNSKQWNVTTWNNVLTIKNGRNQKQVENPYGKYPICGSGGIMGYADDYITNENSVIVGRKGNINKPILMRGKFWNVDTAFGLEPNTDILLVDYLYLYCVFFNFESLNKAVTIPSLTKSDLLNIVMPIPPIELQHQFAEFVEQTDKLKLEVKKSLKKLETLKKSLMQQYFG